jgi:hypothetical protein
MMSNVFADPYSIPEAGEVLRLREALQRSEERFRYVTDATQGVITIGMCSRIVSIAVAISWSCSALRQPK